MEETLKCETAIVPDGTGTISIAEYNRLIMRSFALDVIFEHQKESSYRLEETVEYIRNVLLAAESEA